MLQAQPSSPPGRRAIPRATYSWRPRSRRRWHRPRRRWPRRCLRLVFHQPPQPPHSHPPDHRPPQRRHLRCRPPPENIAAAVPPTIPTAAPTCATSAIFCNLLDFVAFNASPGRLAAAEASSSVTLLELFETAVPVDFGATAVDFGATFPADFKPTFAANLGTVLANALAAPAKNAIGHVHTLVRNRRPTQSQHNQYSLKRTQSRIQSTSLFLFPLTWTATFCTERQ